MKRLTIVALVAIITVGLAFIISDQLSKKNNTSNSEAENNVKPESFLYSSRYRRISEQDSGTLRAYIKNVTDKPLSLSEIRMDGYAMRVWNVGGVGEHPEFLSDDSDNKGFNITPQLPEKYEDGHLVITGSNKETTEEEVLDTKSLLKKAAEKQLIWAKFYPKVLKSGEVGEFMGKFRFPISRPVKLEFITDSGDEFSSIIQPTQVPFKITAITFSEQLNKVYLYLSAQSNEPVEINNIELNGENVTESCRFTDKTLSNGFKQLCIVELHKPLIQGEFVTVKILTDNGGLAERVRIFNSFPIHAEDGREANGFELDEKPYLYRPFQPLGDVNAKYNTNVQHEHDHANYLFQCLNHIFDQDWGKSAELTLYRYDQCLITDKKSPSLAHICRNRPAHAFPRFGELVDLMEINVNYSVYPIKTGTKPWQEAMESIAYACQSASPRPVVGVLDTSAFNSTEILEKPYDFRRKAYAILGQAPKGILYRNWNRSKSDSKMKAINGEIVCFNHQMDCIREHLKIADTCNWLTNSDDDYCDTYSLLAGDSGLVLILIDKTLSNESDVFPPALKKDMYNQSSIQLNLFLPSSLMFSKIMVITPEGLKATGCDFQKVGDKKSNQFNQANTSHETSYSNYMVHLPRPQIADIYFVKLRRKN